MCILSLRLDFVSRFIARIRSLRCCGGEDDALHGRPFLRWLVGSGDFTMPQEAAVYLIILCIHLEMRSRTRGIMLRSFVRTTANSFRRT